MRDGYSRLLRRASAVAVLGALGAACASGGSELGRPSDPIDASEPTTYEPDPSVTEVPPADTTGETTGETTDVTTGETTGGATDIADDQIVIHLDDTVAEFDHRLLGTNVPAWLGPELLADEDFRRQTVESGTTLLRLPGGSWSNHYDWLACELAEEGCYWPWAARPSDFMSLLDATDIPGMWTVSINGTPEEAAAVVAFFNGAVDDNSRIGIDRNGRDWRTVGHWATLRSDRGHAEPVPIEYWEVGNEVFGAIPSAGPGCASFGWEDVWTCDGTEYALGTDEHDGFVQFAEAMRSVDPDIEIGAVGVGDVDEWGAWDHHVIAAAGDAIDFYVVHHYGFDGQVDPSTAMAIPSNAWSGIAWGVATAFERHHPGLTVPIAVTEHNLVSFIDADVTASMTMALNAFYLAETIGQMALNGIPIANQWNIANGRNEENGSDYGLIDVETRALAPAYHAFVAWSQMGDRLLPVTKGEGKDLRQLRVYASVDGDDLVTLAINPSAEAAATTVILDTAAALESDDETSIEFDVVQAEASFDTAMTEASSTGTATNGTIEHVFPPFSITVVRWPDGASTAP